jgi:hypothetical protein
MRNLEHSLDDQGAGIDLTDCAFTDPVGLVAIACAAEQAAAERGTHDYRPPADQSVARYHDRMNVPYVLGDLGVLPTDVQRVKVKSTDTLCELTPFPGGTRPHKMVELAVARLEGTASARIVEAVWMCLIEASQNVADHARARTGYAAAQVYEDRTVGERVVLAIGDAGVGIAGSLATRGEQRPADLVAIEDAVGGRSSTGDPGRGTGLASMRRAVQEFGGQMIVRSGTANLHVWPTREHPSKNLTNLPGTIIGVEMPCA